MSVRTLERSIIRSQCGNTKEFREAWKRYHNAKIEKIGEMNRNYNVAKPKPKKYHWDNGRLAIARWKQLKEYFANLGNQKDTESSDVSSN